METERTKFVVFKANIMDDDGNKVLAGETVALSPKLAKHYNKLGYLRPYMDQDEPEEPEEALEEDDTEEEERKPLPSGTRRITTGPTGPVVRAGATAKPL